jgi:hypothetical protein
MGWPIEQSHPPRAISSTIGFYRVGITGTNQTVSVLLQFQSKLPKKSPSWGHPELVAAKLLVAAAKAARKGQVWTWHLAVLPGPFIWHARPNLEVYRFPFSFWKTGKGGATFIEPGPKIVKSRKERNEFSSLLTDGAKRSVSFRDAVESSSLLIRGAPVCSQNGPQCSRLSWQKKIATSPEQHSNLSPQEKKTRTPSVPKRMSL